MALFGKLVKYVVAKGMKLLPNFIGRTSAQAQEDVVSEGFILGNVTTSVSGEPAEFANDGLIVEQIPAVTTPADYETPVDLTVRQFTFTPFGVFGFSPFSVFGFSPFNVFGFSPFNVFGFSPFRVFGFSPTSYGFTPTPYCIDENTPVLTKEGYKLAKDIVVEDILITKTFDSLPITNHEGLKSWSGDVVTEYGTIESKVTKIKKTNVSETIIINDDIYKRFSTQEDILVVRENKLMFVISSQLKSGDLIVKNPEESLIDGPLYQVRSIEIVKEDRKVYDFMREPFGLIVADSLLVYNAYPVD
jgi:hypothetical protein